MAAVQMFRSEAEHPDLPAVCMKCGSPASSRVRKHFSWHPAWVWLIVLFCGLLPGFIVALILTKRMRVSAPLCEQHASHWSRRTLLIFAGLALVVAAGFGLIATGDRPGLKEHSGLLCFGGFVLLLAWLVMTIILHATSIHATEITDRTIRLTNVSPAFVDAVEARRYQDGFDRLNLVGSRGGGLPIAIAILLPVFVIIVVSLAAIQFLGEPAQFHDSVHGFRLNLPPGWYLLSQGELRQNQAVAGAQTNQGEIVGFIIVEPDEGGPLVIEGNEERIADALMRSANVNQAEVEKIEPMKYQGRSALRIRYTGIMNGQRMRIETIVLIHRGQFFQLIGVGPASKVAGDGSTFRPFFDGVTLQERPPDKGNPGQ